MFKPAAQKKITTSQNYHELLNQKVSEAMRILRILFKGINTNIYNSLNEEYENEIKTLVCMVPNDWLVGFYDSLDLGWDMIKTVNIPAFARTIINHNRARLWFEVDTYEVFIKYCVENNPNISKQAINAAKNIIQRLHPLFDAINFVLRYPEMVLKRLETITETTDANNNILKGLF